MTIKKIESYTLPQEADIPTNKVNWSFEPKKSVLLIHDMQEYFVDFYGENSPLMKSVIDNIQQMINYCRTQNIPIIYTAQPKDQSDEDRALLNDMWGRGLPLHPAKQPIVSELTPKHDDIVLTKWRYSAFYRSSLADIMKQDGRDQLLICGIYGHIGVMQTAVDAFMQDIKPFLIADAVADFSRADHLMALDYIARNAGRVVTKQSIISTSSTFDWTKQALRAQIIPYIEDAEELTDDDNLVDFVIEKDDAA